jgi:MerR family mercuric resistance operon transcriptional regulator
MPAFAPATIAELARKSGVDVESIRLYQENGLLPEPRRRRGRSDDAAYHQEHLDRLIFIRRARELGFTLETVAVLAGLRGGLVTCNDVYHIVERHLAELHQRTGNHSQMERKLKELAGACAKKGSRADCTIIATLSRPDGC